MKKLPILTLQEQFSEFLKRDSMNLGHEIENSVVDQSPICVQEQLLIYKNDYKLRIHESLEEYFPKTLEILKNIFFFQLVEEYIMKYSSTFGSLAEFSKNFPNFISESRWGAEYKFLAELAQFEWLKSLSFSVESSDLCDFTPISKIPQNKHKEIILKLDPSVVFFKSRWSVHCVGIKKFIPKRINFYIIYRNNGNVYYENIPQIFWDILKKISQGLNIGEIIDSSFDLKEQKISKYFSKWISKGIITHFIYKEK